MVLIWIGVAHPITAFGWTFASTYNCSEWVCCTTISCDGWLKHGDWHSSGGGYEQITTAANYSAGGGGRGQRHWLGPGNADNSGGIRLDFADVPEIWVRFYVRFQTGFSWAVFNLYYKLIYINVAENPYFECDWPRGFDYAGICINGRDHLSPAGAGWDQVMVGGALDVNGHRTSDGQWHCFEYHLKTNTSGANGVWEMWVDGVRLVNLTDMDFLGGNFNRVLFGSNHTPTLNPGDMYVDYDDIVISNTGYIGPIGGNPGSPPSSPKNLRISP